LLIAGGLALSAALDFESDHPAQGTYLGASLLFFVPFAFWLAVFSLGTAYTRAAVGTAYGVRALWMGFILGGGVMGGVTYGALIYPLRDRFRCLPPCGFSADDDTERAQYVLVSALALPAVEQLGLLLIVLYLRQDRQRIWKPYSYVILGIHTAIGIAIGEQMVLYGVIFRKTFEPSSPFAFYGEARTVITETVVFMTVIIPYIALCGLLVGSVLLYERVVVPSAKTMRFSGLPSKLVSNAASAGSLFCLWIVCITLRGLPEAARGVIVSEPLGLTESTQVVVYLLLALVWFIGVLYMWYRVLPATYALDHQDEEHLKMTSSASTAPDTK